MLFFLFNGGSFRALPGSGIGGRPLTMTGKPFSMAQSTVTPQIHQSFDIHGDVGPKFPFNLVTFVNGLSNIVDLFFSQTARLDCRIDPGFVKNLSGSAGTDTVNIGQRNPRVLVFW